MRRRNKIHSCPAHIDVAKLPDYCYWDKSGKGHWYTQFKVGERWRRQRIAGPSATLAELHTAIEARTGGDVGNLIWLGKKFKESVQYKQVAAKSRKDWDYCAGVVEKHPSRRGIPIGKIPLEDFSPPAIQKLIDQIAEVNGPSAAAHCARYLRRLCGLGVNRGHMKTSPVGKVELPKERKLRRLPARETVAKLVTLAQERGQRPSHTKGSCSAYIWKALVIAYRCRYRGVEVFDLTDASLLPEGIQSARRKGSKDNITRWHPDLRVAVDAAQAHRARLWESRRIPVPMRAEDRPLIVGEKGQRVKGAAWQNAWRDFLDMAIEAGVITGEQRFGLHDMKRRGITDTKGGKAAKLEGGGHRDQAMLDVYDFELPIVDAAGS